MEAYISLAFSGHSLVVDTMLAFLDGAGRVSTMGVKVSLSAAFGVALLALVAFSVKALVGERFGEFISGGFDGDCGEGGVVDGVGFT